MLANLPHSGTYVPHSIDKRFKQNPKPVLANMDWHLEKLYDFLPELGITLFQATHSRYIVDLNRSLQPPLFGPHESCVTYEDNTWRKPLYDMPLNQGEIEERINKYYHPYHRRLQRILDGLIRDFQQVYLIDLHSFGIGYPNVDICFGDGEGTTCSEHFVACFEEASRRHGFSSARYARWLTAGTVYRLQAWAMSAWSRDERAETWKSIR